MVQIGRRPGNADTRNEILRAARSCFAEHGYTETSIRAVARRSSVDPALVHHYFTDKAGLFMATLPCPWTPGGWPRPRWAMARSAGNGWWRGSWPNGNGAPSPIPPSSPWPRPCARRPRWLTPCGSSWPIGWRLHGPRDEDAALAGRRRSLISSQLVGLAWTRYVVRMEPLASASRAEVARWAGPTLDRYATGPLPPVVVD